MSGALIDPCRVQHLQFAVPGPESQVLDGTHEEPYRWNLDPWGGLEKEDESPIGYGFSIEEVGAVSADQLVRLPLSSADEIVTKCTLAPKSGTELKNLFECSVTTGERNLVILENCQEFPRLGHRRPSRG